jgi:hypothetical protein
MKERVWHESKKALTSIRCQNCELYIKKAMVIRYANIQATVKERENTLFPDAKIRMRKQRKNRTYTSYIAIKLQFL